MNDTSCRRYFLEPQQTFHRRYEALRAYFLERQPLANIARRFGYRVSSLKSLVCRFRAGCVNGDLTPFFGAMGADALPVGNGAKTTTSRSRPPSPTRGS